MVQSPVIIDATRVETRSSPTNLLRAITPARKPGKKPSQFGTALAHEMRNPLSNINLAVAMLKSMISNEDQKLYLDIIMRGADRIDDLVTNFLTSIQASEMHSDEYSIHQLINEIIATTEDRVRLKNITIIKDYTAEDCKIFLNKQKMQIALTNIIINAIEAVPSGNGELKLVTKSIDGKYIIQVKDNGCGISKENLKNIFKPFFTKKPGGLGLGLATTYHILKSSHVGINVESEEGKGTCFILSFDKNRGILSFNNKKPGKRF